MDIKEECLHSSRESKALLVGIENLVRKRSKPSTVLHMAL